MQLRSSKGARSTPAAACHPPYQTSFRSVRKAAWTGRRPAAACRSTVRDEGSGTEFPLVQQFWAGETMRCLGAVTKSKKIVFVSFQVYSVALYVEADKCTKELGIRARGGFFDTDEDFCSALMDGAFEKVLTIRLLRDVDGPTFAEALNKSLVPRMTLSGEMDKLEEFMRLFQGKNLTSGTEVLMLCSVVGGTEVLVLPSHLESYGEERPELKIRSMSLCRGLLELFLGATPVVPTGQKVWASGAKNLLDYENVKRSTRRAGSG